MNNRIRYIIIGILFLLLFLIRGFEKELFYDPLIVYFENDYLYTSIPAIKGLPFTGGLLLRYLLNTFISLGIISCFFQKKDFLKFAVYFYSIAFLILGTLFFILLKDEFKSGYLLIFYVRRFLIHPLFLILLFPLFYYQNRSNTLH